MDYPVQYQNQILSAIQSIDLHKVSQAIQVFKAARAHGRAQHRGDHAGADDAQRSPHGCSPLLVAFPTDDT